MSYASLALLNERLAERKKPILKMNRFRANFILNGKNPHDEDKLGHFSIGTGEMEI